MLGQWAELIPSLHPCVVSIYRKGNTETSNGNSGARGKGKVFKMIEEHTHVHFYLRGSIFTMTIDFLNHHRFFKLENTTQH